MCNRSTRQSYVDLCTRFDMNMKNNLVYALQRVQQQQLGLCTAKAQATTTKFMYCKGFSNNN